jgi:DNA-binding CsgD family transcriptional regulator
MPRQSSSTPRPGVTRAPAFDDRTELNKLLQLCELKCTDQPDEVHRLLHDLTSRVELTGDNLLQTKLLILKAQTELELDDRQATALHLRAAMLTLNSCDALSDLKSELLADLEQRNGSEHGSWDAFRRSFERLYPHFMLSLSSQCPALTPVELKICAMIRGSISTKEMSELIGTSKRVIENHRYHIRQKLGLGAKENLNSYLLCIQ